MQRTSTATRRFACETHSKTEFGKKICVALDSASYFTANAVQEFAEDTPIELCYLPRGSAPVNPAEECWRQLNQELGNRLFDTLHGLRDAALSALNRMNVPDVFTYLCPSVSKTTTTVRDAHAETVGYEPTELGTHLISIQFETSGDCIDTRYLKIFVHE